MQLGTSARRSIWECRRCVTICDAMSPILQSNMQKLDTAKLPAWFGRWWRNRQELGKSVQMYCCKRQVGKSTSSYALTFGDEMLNTMYMFTPQHTCQPLAQLQVHTNQRTLALTTSAQRIRQCQRRGQNYKGRLWRHIIHAEESLGLTITREEEDVASTSGRLKIKSHMQGSMHERHLLLQLTRSRGHLK